MYTYVHFSRVAIPWKQLPVLEVVVVVLFRVHGVRQRCAMHLAGAGQSSLRLHRVAASCVTIGGSIGSAGNRTRSVATIIVGACIVVVSMAPKSVVVAVAAASVDVLTVTGCDSDVDVCESSAPRSGCVVNVRSVG